MYELQPYASLPGESRGRLIPEPESKHRLPHQRDRDRIIHATAFRRLKYKTQVFVYHEGDYYRTRLSHSLEVAQITRALSRTLGLNEDLAEAVALAHDLGHTPFAHAGEDELNELMEPYGGFDHNDQTVRVLTQLESRYADFDGLNLTWESVEGVVKHNGPLMGERCIKVKPLPVTIKALSEAWNLNLDSWASAEAQVAALSDDIAYVNHDIDDGVRSGLISLDDLRAVPLVAEVLDVVRARYPNLDKPRLIHESIRRLMDRMVADLLRETRSRLDALQPNHADDIRCAQEAVVSFSPAFWAADIRPLREFLYANVYRHYRVNRMRNKIRRVVRELFELFLNRPNTLPNEWQQKIQAAAIEAEKRDPSSVESSRARVVADYIAGMTDRYALEEHHRLFDPFAKT